ncbi:hypothetical protein BH10ACI2_BH10ACI2_11310 [soil metagenome]
MKKTIFNLTAIAIFTLSLAAISANAQSGTKYTVNVPFDFSVGEKWFERGDYLVQTAIPASDSTAFIIAQKDGPKSRIAMGTRLSSNSMQTMARLSFNRYGDQYFLSRIETPVMSSALMKSKDERRLVKTVGVKTDSLAMRSQK